MLTSSITAGSQSFSHCSHIWYSILDLIRYRITWPATQRPGSITWHCNDGTSSTKCLPHLIHLKDLSYFLDKGTLVTRDYQPNLNFISGWHTPAKLSHWIKFFINSLIKSLNKIFSWTETLYKQVQLPASSSIIKVKGEYTGWGLIINTKCHWKPARRIPICNLLNLIKQN